MACPCPCTGRPEPPSAGSPAGGAGNPARASPARSGPPARTRRSPRCGNAAAHPRASGPPSAQAQCDWSAGSHRRSLAGVLAGTAPGCASAAPGCASAAPGQHEVGRASGQDSPHLRSGISARAPTSVSGSAKSSSFAGTR